MNDTELVLVKTDIKISLSLQGHLFVFPADNLLCHDWLVKTIVETNVGKDTTLDAIYLDCEPDSFLLIYKILNNLYDIENLSRLSEIALQLLLSSCEYMNCNQIVTAIGERIDKRHSETNAARQEKESLMRKIEEQQQLLDARDTTFLSDKWTEVYECVCSNSHRKYRPGNKCNNPAIIIGDIKVENIECAHCEVSMRVKKMRHRTDIIRKMEEVSNHYERYYDESS